MYLTIEIVRQSSAVMRGIDFSKNKTRETENVFMTDRLRNIYIKRGYGIIGECVGLLLFLLLLFSSCTDESISNGIHTDTGDSTRVNLTFDLQQQTTLTRTLSSTGTSESQVDNINVLIFDNNSKLIGSDYESFGTSKTASFSVSVPTRVASGCTIYAVANLPSDSLKNVATISDFKKKFILMSSTATLGNGNNMIMFGQASSVTISATASSNTPSITLTRLGSKVTFNITPATGITITGYQLCHVPMASYITSATDSTYFNPSATYGDFTSVSGLSSTTQVSPYYYMYENLVGRKSGATSFFNRSKSNAPTNASYLMIYAARADSGWHAVYRVYLGGTGMSDYTNYNVPRNYSYTYNINIDGADEADVRVRCLPNIGDYYYSDGTFGASASPTGKTTIGVVFSNAISATDSVKGWTHGYAMALTNAASAVAWSSSTYSSTQEFTPLVSSLSDYETQLDGYTHCQTVKAKAGSNLSSNYPAISYALNYSAYTAPSSSSGWYLPSTGQWYQIITNLGGISIGTTPTSITTNGLIYWYYSGGASTTSSGINSYLSKVVSGSNLIDWASGGDRWYWCSSERSGSYACIMYLDNGASLNLIFTTKTNTDVNNRVRSVVAF